MFFRCKFQCLTTQSDKISELRKLVFNWHKTESNDFKIQTYLKSKMNVHENGKARIQRWWNGFVSQSTMYINILPTFLFSSILILDVYTGVKWMQRSAVRHGIAKLQINHIFTVSFWFAWKNEFVYKYQIIRLTLACHGTEQNE